MTFKNSHFLYFFLLLFTLKLVNGQSDICHKVMAGSKSYCSTSEQCTKAENTEGCSDKQDIIYHILQYSVITEECKNGVANSSIMTPQYTYMSYPLHLKLNNTCLEQQLKASHNGEDILISHYIYCLSLEEDISFTTNNNGKPVYTHFSLEIDLSTTETVSDKRYLGIASHPGINVFKEENSVSTNSYNMTAISCELSIAAYHEVLLGGTFFLMSEMADQDESCLVISDGNDRTAHTYTLCNNNSNGFPVKHILLPCQEKPRTVDITYRGPNSTWFFLPVLGSDEQSFSISCKVGEWVENEVQPVTTNFASQTEADTEGQTRISTAKETSTVSSRNILDSPKSSSLIIIIVCALGGVLVIVTITVTVIICCYKRKKGDRNESAYNNHAVDNPVYVSDPPEFDRYMSHIQTRPSPGVQGGAAGGNLSQEDRVYQVDVDMPKDEKKFDIQQQTAVMTDPSGLYAVPNLSAKKSRRNNASSSHREGSGRSDYGSLGWDNSGANEANPGFQGEMVEMVENDVYSGN